MKKSCERCAAKGPAAKARSLWLKRFFREHLNKSFLCPNEFLDMENLKSEDRKPNRELADLHERSKVRNENVVDITGSRIQGVEARGGQGAGIG